MAAVNGGNGESGEDPQLRLEVPPSESVSVRQSYQRFAHQTRRTRHVRAARNVARSTSGSQNIVPKLIMRETFGSVRSSMRRPFKSPLASSKFFNTSLPARLGFCLRDIIPESAIQAGHIFLGFSKCGQFLISYTQTPEDLDVVDFIQYTYRLHWWLFVPSRRAKKVSEIILFGNQGANGNLHISFSFWPNDPSKIVVFGYMICESEGMTPDQSSHPCYLTVTAVPSLKGCKDCAVVAASYSDEDVAEAWNSCVRLSCLRHGLTIHTTFDLVQPYPVFEPKINLKRDGCIVINTGNLLHSFKIEFEDLGMQRESLGVSDSNYNSEYAVLPSPPSKGRWAELHVGTNEFTFSGGEIFSPPIVSPSSCMPNSAVSDSETTDCESDHGGCGNRFHIQNEERLEKVAHFLDLLRANSCPAATGQNENVPRSTHRVRRIIKASGTPPEESSFSSNQQRKTMAEKAYELTEDDFDDGVKEKLSTFRKKRLAEKTYEFKDEDSENVTPLPKLRSQNRNTENNPENPMSTLHPVPQTRSFIKSPRSTEVEENVLKPIMANQSAGSSTCHAEKSVGTEEDKCFSDADGVLTVNVPSMSPGGISKYSNPMFSPVSNQQNQSLTPKFHAKFTRRFIEMDDEMISVITDIEDDDLGSQVSSSGYHTALPLEVHGSGYQSLSMISNTKAQKLTAKCVKITQRSFDLEVFCHHMAQRLCNSVNMKYWFCNDYDVEIVDFDPETGDVIFVAVVLVQATMFIKKAGKSGSSLSQQGKASSSGSTGKQIFGLTSSKMKYHAYEANFKFSWNVDTSECTVIDSDALKEFGPGFDARNTIWHPAKEKKQALQSGFSSMKISGVKSFTNEAVISGRSLKTIFDPDHLVAITHEKSMNIDNVW